MKSFLKKINRGVILSLLIILGIACYYAVIAIKNAPHKEEMVMLLDDFYNDFEQVFIVPEEYLKEGITEEQVEPLYNDIKVRLRPYFADEEHLETFFTEQIKEQIFLQTVQPYNHVQFHTCEFVGIKSVKIDHKEHKATLYCTYMHESSMTYYDLEFTEGGVKRSNPHEYRSMPFKADCSFSLVQTDGKWKIERMQTGHWF